MSIRDLPPERLLQQALKLVERGRLDTAQKLLRLATLKAPGDQTIQATLAQVEQAQAQAADDSRADAQDVAAMLSEAQAAVDAGELDAAARTLQMLLAARPDDKRIRALYDEVRDRRAGKARRDVGIDFTTREKLKEHIDERDWEAGETLLRERLKTHRDSASLHQQLAMLLLYGADNARGALPHAREAAQLGPDQLDPHILLHQALRFTGQAAAASDAREVAERLAAAADVNLAAHKIELRTPFEGEARSTDGPGAPAPRSGAPPWKLAAAAVAMLALVAVVGGMWWSLQPVAIDVTPYQLALPVTAASQMPKPTEVKLQLDDATWKGLDRDAQQAALRSLQVVASQQGYDAVFLEGTSGAYLGSALPDLVWVAD
jgi:predicted Zn-dependent protease